MRQQSNSNRTPLQIEYDETFYEHEGQSKTIAEWAKYKGVPFGVLSMWLAVGHELEEAIRLSTQLIKKKKNKSPAKRPARLFLYDGKFLTVKEISEITNIKTATIYMRMKNGLDITAAASAPLHYNNRCDTFTFKGQTKSLREWSEVKGIGLMTLRERLLRGWTIENALTIEVGELIGKRYHRGWVQTSVEPSETGQLRPRDSLPKQDIFQ